MKLKINLLKLFKKNSLENRELIHKNKVLKKLLKKYPKKDRERLKDRMSEWEEGRFLKTEDWKKKEK